VSSKGEPKKMRTTARALSAAALLTPLALAATAGAASAASAAAPRAASVTENCFGHQHVTMTPKITDSPQQVSGTVTYTLGDDDDLLGILGSSNCRSTDGNQTSAGYPGATATITFTASASCNGLSNIVITGGDVTWDDGETSAISTSTKVPLIEVDHGDGASEQLGTIASGAFAGATLDLQNQESTPAPNACETSGIGQVSGTASLELKTS
jgi:hypothetical protein